MSRFHQAILIVLGVTVVALAPAALQHSSLRWNQTASEPEGLYRISRNGSSYAAICLPEAVVKTALDAGLRLPSGECPGGREPILKTVYRATLTAPITFTPSGFIVGSTLLKNTAPNLRSKTGQPLAHEAYGTYTSGVWAISDYNPNSFDSRYFGSVPESSIRYYAKPFFLF